MAQLKPVAFRHQGRFVGWQITAVFPDEPGLCSPCGIAVGDVILSVNGDPLQTPTALVTLIEAIPNTTSLRIVSLRDERRRIVNYAIVDSGR